MWFLTELPTVRGQNKTYEGPFRRTLFFLGILVGMRLILFGMLAFAGTLPVGAPWPVTEAETLASGKVRLPDAAMLESAYRKLKTHAV